jgi:hypothetical protein
MSKTCYRNSLLPVDEDEGSAWLGMLVQHAVDFITEMVPSGIVEVDPVQQCVCVISGFSRTRSAYILAEEW